MADPAACRLTLCDWVRAEAKVMPLRVSVFVAEQGVPMDMELDEFDPLSVHAVVENLDGEVVGTGRLLPDGHIGRLAVAAQCRGHGIGGRILDALVAEARRRGMGEVLLHAQLHAELFYLRRGFLPEGEIFDEAGIAHRLMRKVLAERRD